MDILGSYSWELRLACFGAVIVFVGSLLVLVGLGKGWCGTGAEDAAFEREFSALEKKLSEVEDSLRPVIGLATARDKAAKAAWEQEQRRKQEPPDDDDGFLADGNSDDERLRGTVRRRAVPNASTESSTAAERTHFNQSAYTAVRRSDQEVGSIRIQTTENESPSK